LEVAKNVEKYLQAERPLAAPNKTHHLWCYCHKSNLPFFTRGFVQYGYNATFPTTVNSNERSGFRMWLHTNTGKHPDLDSPELSLLPPVSK